MKTEDLVQIGALAVVGYLAWQKFAKASPSTQAGVSAPSKPVTTPLLPDFGSSNAGSGWDDADDTGNAQGIGFVQAIIGDIL